MLNALALTLASLIASLTWGSAPPGWVSALETRVKQIDQETEGELGIYVKSLGDGSELNYQADRKWYLASTTKVPIAIVALQLIEERRIRPTEKITLKRSDYVDGSGSVNWAEPGTKFSFASLIEKMIVESDSSATDLVVKRIQQELGAQGLQKRLRSKLGLNSAGTFTSILQVRKDAYQELHPKTAQLTNMDFIELKKLKNESARLEWILERLQLKKADLKQDSIENAFEAYYARELNSAPLLEFGRLLEALEKGKLLSSANQQKLLGYMEAMKTGEKRIKAGLPLGTRFAQKTGTQINRMCNVGIVRDKQGSNKASGVVITTCLEKFSEPIEAETALRKIGESLLSSELLPPSSTASSFSSAPAAGP